MSRFSLQIGDWFLSETEQTEVNRDARNPVVLGTEGTAFPLAALLAGELRVTKKKSSALVCIWSSGKLEVPRKSMSTPAARKLAAKLSVRDLPAVTPKGSLVWMPLSRDPDEAIIELRRARSSVDVPIVLALAGVRSSEFNGVVWESDLVLVAMPKWSNDALERLTVFGVETESDSVLPCRPLSRGHQRVAMSGYRCCGAASVALHSATVFKSIAKSELIDHADSVAQILC